MRDVKVDPGKFGTGYSFSGRTIEYHRAQIREALGFREAGRADEERLTAWLADEVCPVEPGLAVETEQERTLSGCCDAGSRQQRTRLARGSRCSFQERLRTIEDARR